MPLLLQFSASNTLAILDTRYFTNCKHGQFLVFSGYGKKNALHQAKKVSKFTESEVRFYELTR